MTDATATRTIPTPDTTIIIGDLVKSYDFPEDLVLGPRPGVGQSYVEGRVIGIKPVEGCDRYQILVTRRMRSGVLSGPRLAGECIFPPVNGTPTYGFSEVTFGVVKSNG
jgi:hypothetical protein